MALIPQELLSSESKLDSAKPTVLISIDIQEGKNINDNLQKDCSKINNPKHNHGWQIQEPFYVEEPRWVNIHDINNSPQRLYKDEDPYILSRGKKIFRMKGTEQAEKMVKNYEDFLNKYPSRSKRSSTKNRVRRSVVINEKYQNNMINESQKDQKKETNYYNFLQDIGSNNVSMTKSQDKKSYKINKMSEDRKNEEDITTNSVYDIFVEKYQREKLKNATEKLPYEFKFTKGNQTSANDEKIISFIERKQNVQREGTSNRIKNNNGKIVKINHDKKFNNREAFFITDTNKKDKRSVLLKDKNFSEVYNKYKTREMDTSFDENVKRNETDVHEQMKNKAYTDELDDLNTYNDDTFTSSRKNPDDRTESSNKKDTDRDKFIERPWRIQYSAHREELENAEKLMSGEKGSIIDRNNTEATDLQSTGKSDSGTENYFDRRRKRSACENCKIDPQQDQWLRDMEREIQDSLSLERRNKHSDILEDLSLHEPYVISRGKKASRGHESGSIYSMLKPRNFNDAGRVKAKSFSLKALLRVLLMEMPRCNNCKINTNPLSNKRSPRDRRGLLDEILTAYDPYYVVRGKRINLDKY